MSAKKATKKAAAKKTAVKKATKHTRGRGARGTGKFFFDTESKEFKRVTQALERLKKPTTTKEIAGKMGLPTWKVRLASNPLVANKTLKRKHTGNVFTLSPA